jgi:hypothetical protein
MEPSRARRLETEDYLALIHVGYVNLRLIAPSLRRDALAV